MDNKIDAKSLESGNVLKLLKLRFMAQRSEENLFPLLQCLRDSVVLVPMTAILSERDQETIKNLQAGDEWKSQDDIRLCPDVLESPDGLRWFPMFSQREQIPDEYAQQFSIMPVETLRCLSMGHSLSDIKGIVLDAFTESLTIPFEIADIITKLESRIE